MPPLPSFVRRPEVVLAAMFVAFVGWAAADWYLAEPRDSLTRAKFVGRDSCVRCHQQEAAAWTGSNHDRAMELATDDSVLGDFNNVTFERLGERSRFFRDGKRFMVNAEGPDGTYRDYEIKWTFGIDPLQQYMVEMESGRIQVLRVSWDVHKNRWFYVTPPDVTDERIEAGDPLHWTGLAQNWNTMCAECHSTDYHKNFNLAKNSYAHEFSEIDVSCEACHGPGSLHVELAERHDLFWDRNVGYGLTNSLKNVSNVRHVETCAPCHSRRAIIHADYRPGAALYDNFDPVLLYNGLYFSDGQIEDEVYEHGSFTQSKMYRKNVRCSDCHNPHSLELKFEGNKLCLQCHIAGKYDGAGHHHHTAAAEGAAETKCVSCHMPTRTYMVVDDRHDHSLRVPRPDLSVKLGTPNACNSCHTKEGEDAAWSAAKVVEWYGEKRPDDPHWANALDAAQQGQPDGEQLLSELLDRAEQPELVRATAVSLLAAYPTMASERVLQRALRDDSPAVRASAVRAYSTESPARLLSQVRPLLDDPMLAVRMAATQRLVAAAPELAQTEFRDVLRRAAADYREGQANNLDRVESHMSLATLAEQLGDLERAITSFRNAMRVEPYRAGPRRELARLLDYVQSDPTQAALRTKLKVSADEIRSLRAQEVDLLARDAKLLPNDATSRYNRGLLLYLLEDLDGAREAFEDAVRVSPAYYDAHMAIALVCEKQERWEQAAEAIKSMAKLQPKALDWRAALQHMRETVLAQQAEEQAAAAPHSESLSSEQREVEPDGEPPPAEETQGSKLPAPNADSPADDANN